MDREGAPSRVRRIGFRLLAVALAARLPKRVIAAVVVGGLLAAALVLAAPSGRPHTRFVLGGAQVLFAVHTDFFVESQMLPAGPSQIADRSSSLASPLVSSNSDRPPFAIPNWETTSSTPKGFRLAQNVLKSHYGNIRPV